MASLATVTLGIMIWAVTVSVLSWRRSWPAASSFSFSFSFSAASCSSAAFVSLNGLEAGWARVASCRRRLTVSVMSSFATPANWPARLVLKASWSNVASVAAIVKVELTTGL